MFATALTDETDLAQSLAGSASDSRSVEDLGEQRSLNVIYLFWELVSRTIAATKNVLRAG